MKEQEEYIENSSVKECILSLAKIPYCIYKHIHEHTPKDTKKETNMQPNQLKQSQHFNRNAKSKVPVK